MDKELELLYNCMLGKRNYNCHIASVNGPNNSIVIEICAKTAMINFCFLQSNRIDANNKLDMDSEHRWLGENDRKYWEI